MNIFEYEYLRTRPGVSSSRLALAALLVGMGTAPVGLGLHWPNGQCGGRVNDQKSIQVAHANESVGNEVQSDSDERGLVDSIGQEVVPFVLFVRRLPPRSSTGFHWVFGAETT